MTPDAYRHVIREVLAARDRFRTRRRRDVLGGPRLRRQHVELRDHSKDGEQEKRADTAEHDLQDLHFFISGSNPRTHATSASSCSGGNVVPNGGIPVPLPFWIVSRSSMSV